MQDMSAHISCIGGLGKPPAYAHESSGFLQIQIIIIILSF